MAAEYVSIPRQWRSMTDRIYCENLLVKAFEAADPACPLRRKLSAIAFKDRVTGPDLFPELQPKVTRYYGGNVTPLSKRPLPLKKFQPLLQACLATMVEQGSVTDTDRNRCEEIMGWREPETIEPHKTEIIYLPTLPMVWPETSIGGSGATLYDLSTRTKVS